MFKEGEYPILDSILSNLSEGIMIFDAQKKLLLINQSAKNIFNVNDSIVGQSIQHFLNIPRLKNLFYLLGKDIKETSKRELEIGDNMFLEVTSVKMKIDENGIFYHIVILYDISREKSFEAMRTEFISISAHQLRTPSSAIKWVFESLLRERAGKLTFEQKSMIEEGYTASKRLIGVINDLLNIVRIEGEKYFYKFAYCDFEKVFQKALDPYKKIIIDKQIKFNFQFPERKLPKVKIDEEKISLAIQNMLDNAITYTMNGGIVSVAVDVKDNELEFSIQDTGVGIPAKEQDKIFKKFFRGSNALKIDPEGNGLGLFVAKSIIEAHQGRIWFHSQEGYGTSFYFTLPIG